MAANQPSLQEIIDKAVMQAFEAMTFTVVDRAEESLTDAERAECIKVAQLILEPRPGKMSLMMPRALASELAKDLHTISDEEATEDILQDTVAELLNTITGSVMKQVLPHEHVFKLGLPETGEQASLAADPSQIQSSYIIEGRHFVIMAFLESFDPSNS